MNSKERPMTSRDRVLTAIGHREPDRVPIDYAANPGLDGRMKRHFGLDPGDDEGLRRVLGVDFRRVGAPYKGRKLHADVPDRQVDMWGTRRRWVAHENVDRLGYRIPADTSHTLGKPTYWY